MESSFGTAVGWYMSTGAVSGQMMNGGLETVKRWRKEESKSVSKELDKVKARGSTVMWVGCGVAKRFYSYIQ
jgi:hypothetical protein